MVTRRAAGDDSVSVVAIGGKDTSLIGFRVQPAKRGVHSISKGAKSEPNGSFYCRMNHLNCRRELIKVKFEAGSG